MSTSSAIKSFDDDPNVEVARDQDVVCGLDHVQQPWSPVSPLLIAGGGEEAQLDPQSVARRYLLETADAYGIPQSFLREAQAQLSDQEGLSDAPPALKLAEERTRHKSTAVTYQQTFLGLPVWNAKFSITLDEKLQVVNSVNSVKPDASAPRKPADRAKYLNETGEDGLREALGFRPGEGQVSINKQNLLVYLYNKHERQEISGEGEDSDIHGAHFTPTLVLTEVPDSIQNGRYYVVREVLFTLPLSGYGNLNWRTFIEVETGSVIYLRALTASVSRPAYGWVFTKDPTTRIGSTAPRPSGSITELNLLREKMDLPDVVWTSPQTLKGEYAEIKDFDAPSIRPPTSSTGEFDFSVETDGFAAASGYYHIATLFRLVADLGFTITTLFNGTSFPVPVDHRGFGNIVNAQAPGNQLGNGSGGFIFGRSDPSSAISISTDFRIAAHEFGHALLWDAVSSPNFGFAHSPGDTLGAIYCDPGSKAPDRFDTFPWSIVRRRHDREIADGWAWGGPQNLADRGRQYPSEQILSTSLFRIYRAIGGDAIGDVPRQTWASKYTLCLILGGIASLTTVSPTPDQYVSLMMFADNGTILDYPGGAIRKIVRWAFEKQGLYQRPGAPRPVTSRGAPPAVDVYINDGRNGEYDFVDDFDEAPGIWNRHAADGDRINQTPVVGVTNYCYVTIQNRGIQAAQDIKVKAYHSKVITARKWDADFDETTAPASIAIPTSIPAGGRVDVGPFEWTPDHRFVRHSLLVSVSAKGDLSNIDPESGLDCAAGPINLDKLVPFDNNLAMRTM